MKKENEEEITTKAPAKKRCCSKKKTEGKKCCSSKPKAEGKKCCSKKKTEGKKCCGKKKAEDKEHKCECGDDCKCSENGGVCFCSLTSEIFTQLQDMENLETLMKNYFYTELLERDIEENLANTLANKLVVNIENFEADLFLEEDDEFDGDNEDEDEDEQ